METNSGKDKGEKNSSRRRKKRQSRGRHHLNRTRTVKIIRRRETRKPHRRTAPQLHSQISLLMVSRYLARREPYKLVAGEYVDRAVRALLHLTDSPLAIFEQFFLGHYFVAVEHQSHKVLPGHRANE